MRGPPASRRRAPLLAFAIVTLLAGLWAGLRRVGWGLPYLDPHLVPAHGPLMIVGFLGTLIGVERAVAAKRPWGYVAPIASCASVPGLFLDTPAAAASLAALGGAALLALAFDAFVRQKALFTFVMLAGAAALLVGDLRWCFGAPVYAVVPLWGAFLLLTIVGERLEMTRLLPPSPRRGPLFLFAAAVYVAGVLSSPWLTAAGPRLRGLGMIGLAGWLVHYDIARKTARQQGLPRFVALSLLVGYAWLAVAGALAVVDGDLPAGDRYDAAVHALMLGFVFSMIFAHAPVIFPAVAGVDVPYHRSFYAHLALLHLGLLVRVAGDLVLGETVRAWGAMLTTIAVVVFLGSTARAVLTARTTRSARHPS